MNCRRAVSVIALVAGTMVFVGSCSRSPSNDQGQGQDAGQYDKLVLGKVAGKDFTVADLKKKLKYQYGVIGDVKDPSGVDQARDILKSAVDELCWVHMGEKKGYQNDPEFKATWDLSRRYILADRAIEHEVRSKEVPTDQEIRDYYNQNQADFQLPARVQAAHVLLKTEAEAKAARARLLKGEPIAVVAAQMSIDEPTKKAAGMIGWITATSGAGHLGRIPQFSEAAMQLQKGEVSQPVEIPTGWSVIYAADRSEAHILPLDDKVIEAAKKRLRTKKHNQIFKETLDGLKKEYGAEIYMDNFEKYARSLLSEDELFQMAQREKDPDHRLADYQEIVRRFPAGVRVSQAQFMIGFILADERKDYAAAREAFQAYIQKYPDQELVPSARWMLENMDKPDVDHSSVDQIGRQARFGH